MPTIFAVSSWGNSGIPWMMSCMNLHPKMRVWACMNSGGSSPLGRSLTTEEYLDAIARLGWAEAPVCGDLCAVAWDQFPALGETFGDRFRGAILVAHPVQRLAGSFAFSHEVGRTWSHSDFLRIWNMKADDPRAIAAYGVLGEDGDHIPASYMAHVNTIADLWGSTGALREPVFRLEDLMQSDEAWTAMIDYLSAGEIPDYGATWRPLQGHYANMAHEPFRQSPREVWDAFPDYVRGTMAAMLTDPARAAFENLGYDLSFVR